MCNSGNESRKRYVVAYIVIEYTYYLKDFASFSKFNTEVLRLPISNGMKIFTSNNQKIGEIGENIACAWLEKHCFSVKERNYTKKWGEIDIIAEKGGKLYFIEVKSVSCATLPDLTKEDQDRKRPEENMHPWKMKRLARVVQTYLIHHRIGNKEWQFNLMLVFLDMEKRTSRVKVLENIIL